MGELAFCEKLRERKFLVAGKRKEGRYLRFENLQGTKLLNII
jgi:hypothetical protein